MQVLEHEHERNACREQVQRVAQFPQHPVLGGPDGFLLKLGAGATGAKGGRKLKTPGGRVAPEHCGHPGSARAGQERVERIEEWQVGLAGPVLFDATAASHEQRAGPAPGAENELVGQCRLADAGLSADQDRAPAFRDRVCQRVVKTAQLLFAAHDVPRFFIGARLGRGQRDPGRPAHRVLQEAERVGELDGGEPLLGGFGHRPLDQEIELRRHVGARRAGRRRIHGGDVVHDRQRAGAVERARPAGGFVEQTAQRERIAAAVQRLSPRLFG